MQVHDDGVSEPLRIGVHVLQQELQGRFFALLETRGHALLEQRPCLRQPHAVVESIGDRVGEPVVLGVIAMQEPGLRTYLAAEQARCKQVGGRRAGS